jgi:hypothetical protein
MSLKGNVGRGKCAIIIGGRTLTTDAGNVAVPIRLNANDLDWSASRPLKPWSTGPNAVQYYTAYWEWQPRSIALLELRTVDVIEMLCGTSIEMIQGERKTEDTRHVARPRGTKPKKSESTKQAMRDDIRSGRLTVDGLRNLQEKEMEARYGVSRDTARKSRDAVLSENVEN